MKPRLAVFLSGNVKIINILLTFLLVYLTWTQAQEVVQPRIPCPLEWTQIHLDGSLPTDSIDVYATQQYSSRIEDGDNYYLGRFDTTTKNAHCPVNGIEKKKQICQILTNPHKCTVTWVDTRYLPNSYLKLIVGGETSGIEFVGRGVIGGNLVAGSVSNDLKSLQLAWNGRVETLSDFQICISYKTGFNVVIKNFKFETDPLSTENYDFMGFDTIENKAETTVSHEVTYSKEVTNRYSLTEAVTCSSTFSLSAGLIIGLAFLVGGGATGDLQYQNSGSWSKSFTSETVKNITISRKVTVEPFKSVQICSAVQITPENFQSNYTATAEYTYAGWSASQIVQYFQTEYNSTDVVELDERTAVKVVSGVLQGAIGMMAKIQVFKKDDPDGCKVLQQKVLRRDADYVKAEKLKFQEKMKQKKFKPTVDLPGIAPIADASTIDFHLCQTKCDVHFLYELIVGDYDNLAESNFDRDAPVKIITHGWTSDYRVGTSLGNGYLTKLGRVNVILLDWEELADGAQYNVAAANTALVGRMAAGLIEFLTETGYTTLDKVHLIGHSLGAHVVGYAGAFMIRGKVGRITALDPALPLFIDQCDANRIDPTDAEFVDVIHTAGGSSLLYLSFIEPRGHADFYPNGGSVPQPGCPDDEILLPLRANCSHNKVWNYVNDSIYADSDADEWRSCLCNSYNDYTSGSCPCSEVAQLGEHCDSAARGKFYLRTK